MTPGQILIVSDDSEFVRALVTRWRAEKDCPAITTVSTEASREASSSAFAMVVVGPLRNGTAPPQGPLLQSDAAVCAVGDEESLKVARAAHSAWLFVPECPGWTRILFSLAGEVQRRTAAETRAREAEIANVSQRRFGLLGKSLQEARPGMVNALTSLLGNADLMMLSEEPLPEQCREQVSTIHTMALRLHEIVQRLASVENELELAERKSHVETRAMARAETLEAERSR